MDAISAQAGSCRRNLRPRASAHVKYLPLAAMAPMLIGVYEGLFAACAELGLADAAKATAFRKDWRKPVPTGAITA
jgi:hypothetical protein